jgi:hypothetical protein
MNKISGNKNDSSQVFQPFGVRLKTAHQKFNKRRIGSWHFELK